MKMRNQIIFLLIILSFLVLPTISGQSQIGNDINGEAAFDHSSIVSLSSDGNRIAIGARNNDGNGDDAGHVRVYDWNGNNWLQVGNDIDGENETDFFGNSVSITSDGNRLAIGAPFGQNLRGYVKVYDWDGSSWLQIGNNIDGEADGDRSGFSLSFSSDGDRLAIGASHNDGNGGQAGHVRVYDWDGSTWTQVDNDIDGEHPNDLSGAAIALSGDGNRVIIGAVNNSDVDIASGHARIYEWDGNAWLQIGTDLDGVEFGEFFGRSVSISDNGNRIAIGGTEDFDNGTFIAGVVRVYDWDGIEWIQVGTDIEGEALEDSFGTSISLSSDGSRIGIGASSNDGNGANSGHARLYELIDDDWTQVGIDIDGEANDDLCGTSVSLSNDGNRIAVGAFNNDGNGTNSGHVRIYEFDAPLPVELLYFRGETTDSGNLLSWSTITEVNNDYFVVEHSIDGQNFFPIAEIEGHGTSITRHYYEFVHSTSVNGNSYYRLIQVNFNGDTEYSDIINIKKEVEKRLIYPNPTTGKITIIGTKENTSIEVTSIYSEKIYTFQLDNGQIDLSNLQSGVYFIHFTNSGISEIIKVQR